MVTPMKDPSEKSLIKVCCSNRQKQQHEAPLDEDRFNDLSVVMTLLGLPN